MIAEVLRAVVDDLRADAGRRRVLLRLEGRAVLARVHEEGLRIVIGGDRPAAHRRTVRCAQRRLVCVGDAVSGRDDQVRCHERAGAHSHPRARRILVDEEHDCILGRVRVRPSDQRGARGSGRLGGRFTDRLACRWRASREGHEREGDRREMHHPAADVDPEHAAAVARALTEDRLNDPSAGFENTERRTGRGPRRVTRLARGRGIPHSR